jgi:hypothetical protein
MSDPLLVSALADAMVEASERGASETEIERLTEVALNEAFRRIARKESEETDER